MDGDGFDRQRDAILQHAAANGMEVVRFFEERGVPGKTEWEDRPAWVEMIAALNGINTVVVEKLDRLARDLFIQEYILRDLKKRKVTLLSVHDENIDDSTPERILVRQIMGSLAQYEKNWTVIKLMAARRRIRSAGARCEGRKPYGSKPGESEVLERIVRMSGSLNAAEIARALNADGIPPRSGTQWWAKVVGRILRAQEVTHV